MRTYAEPLLSAAGVLAVLAFIGGVAKTVTVWRSPRTACAGNPRAQGVETVCVRVEGLAKVPWTWLGLSVGMLLLAVCLFTLRELIHTDS